MSELEIPTAVAVLAVVGTIGFFILLIWSMKRHRDPRLEVDCDAPIEDLIPSMAGLTLGTVVDGNSVEVLENRAFFDALIDEVQAARRSVHFETFLWKEGAVGFAARGCLHRARAGGRDGEDPARCERHPAHGQVRRGAASGGRLPAAKVP